MDAHLPWSKVSMKLCTPSPLEVYVPTTTHVSTAAHETFLGLGSATAAAFDGKGPSNEEAACPVCTENRSSLVFVARYSPAARHQPIAGHDMTLTSPPDVVPVSVALLGSGTVARVHKKAKLLDAVAVPPGVTTFTLAVPAVWVEVFAVIVCGFTTVKLPAAVVPKSTAVAP
jgi:hypothetical protein